MATEPEPKRTIDREYITTFASNLGFDPAYVFSIRITHDLIEVVEFDRDEQGNYFTKGEEFAKKHTNIRVTNHLRS